MYYYHILGNYIAWFLEYLSVNTQINSIYCSNFQCKSTINTITSAECFKSRIVTFAHKNGELFIYKKSTMFLLKGSAEIVHFTSMWGERFQILFSAV